MSKEFSLDHTVAAAPSAVYAVLTDLDQAPQWMPAILKVQKLSDTPLAPGAKWIETRRDPRGKIFVSTISVAAMDANERLALNVDHKSLGMQLYFRLEPHGDGAQTVVHYKAVIAPKGIAKLFGGKILKMMQESDKDLLERLGKHVAAQAPKPVAKAPAASAAKAAKATKPKAPAKASKAKGAKKGK